MKIATWNVNSLTARFARVEEWLITREIDIALLQETKQTDAKFPTSEFTRLGYESAHFGQSQWNGVAILSRVGLSNVGRGFGGENEEARFIEATCGPLRAYCCYVPNGRSLDDPHYAYKLEWLATLQLHLAARPLGEACFVGGDFNVAPTTRDVWDEGQFSGATHVSVAERAALADVIATGLVDMERYLHPEDSAFTWWDYRNGSFHRGWGLRIDLVLLDAATAARARACTVDRDARKGDKPSDHAPVIVDVDL